MSTLPGINEIPFADIPCMEIQIVDSTALPISQLLSYVYSSYNLCMYLIAGAYNLCMYLIAGISYQMKLH